MEEFNHGVLENKKLCVTKVRFKIYGKSEER